MGLLRKALFGVGVVGLVIALLVAAVFLGLLGVPSAGVEDVGDWGTVTDDRTEVVTTLWVTNPNPFGLTTGSAIAVEYDLYMNDVAVASGGKEGIAVQPGNNTVQFSTEIRNRKLQDWWVAFVRNNETIPIRVDASADIDAGPLSTNLSFPPFERTLLANATPVVSSMSGVAATAEGSYTESVSAERLSSTAFGDLLGGIALPGSGGATVGYEVRRGWATWGTVTDERTELLLNFRVHNPSQVVPVPAEPDSLGASITMNDVQLLNASGDDVALANPENFTLLESLGGRVIEPGETRTVTYAVTMDNSLIDDWFRSHVRRGEVTDLAAQFQLVFGVGDTTFRVPQGEAATYSCQLRTGILVDGQATTTDCGEAASLAP